VDIMQFRNKLGAGGARPNQFTVILNFPIETGITTDDTSLLVSAAALPASNVNPAIVMYRGREVKFAGERTFDPWTITVLNDTDMKMRKAFERWSDLMNNRTDNSGEIIPNFYMSTLVVQQLDRNEALIRGYQIFNAFPITVSEVGLSYAANDVISEFNVTFQYSHFDVNPV
jgi:T4-like virus tail tube protein gp19